MFGTVDALSGWWYVALALSLFNVAAAAAAVWYARKRHRVRPAPALPPSPPAPSPPPSQPDAEEIRTLLERLHELAATTAQEVGEHNTRMESVSAQISECVTADDGQLRKSLLAAARQMLEANQKLHAELAEARAELHDHARRIEVHMTEARTDALAGVANRRALDEELTRRYAAWQRQGIPLSFMILDVDHFKRFNDTYGHQAGDEVLRGIGRVLAASVRDMDFVARYGGEEFAFVLPGTRLDDAKSAAERIRTAIAGAKHMFADQELSVTMSVGLAELCAGDTLASLLKSADTALYAAKSNGRNRSYYYEKGECLPVDTAEVAVRAEVGKVIHQQLAEADCEPWSTDRRSQVRRRFLRTQSIAPSVNGQFPAPDAFRDVQCRDLTSKGFAFWLPTPPDFSSLVVALGTDDDVKYLLAEVVHTDAIRHGDKTECLVGCRFTGRIDPDGTRCALAGDEGSRMKDEG